MLKKSRIAIVCLLLLMTVACASPDKTSAKRGGAEASSYIVWPEFPQKPRIQYLKSISDPKDEGITKSWFQKTMESVFGQQNSALKMLRPYGVFADTNIVYVTDPGNSVLHIFLINEGGYRQIREVGQKKLISPIGVAVDQTGEIYLTDSILNKVFVVNNEGKYIREIGSADFFIRPAGISLQEDRVYIVDTHGHRIAVFSKKDGKLLFYIGSKGKGDGEFHYPTNIFSGRDGFLYITDSMNFRIQIFDREGRFISAFGKHGDGSGDFSKPKGIAIDSEGHIYVADAHFDNVQIFDRDGHLLLRFGEPGRNKGQMLLPAGIFIDSNDRIYVADSFNRRIQIFQYLKEGQ